MDAHAEAYVDYVRGVIPLKIWHAWNLNRRADGRIPAAKVLEEYVDIWRKTRHYDGDTGPGHEGFASPEWDRMKCALLDLFAQHADDTTSETLEQASLDYLWPDVEPCIEKESRPPRKGEDRPFGCWTYTLRPNNEFSVHITNVYRPDSPFDHFDEYAADLLRIIRHGRQLHRERTTLFCGSWMNHLPPFRMLFPPVWGDNLHRPIPYNGSSGAWGQYMDRQGGFHRRNADRFRATGEHPYPLIHSLCDLDEAEGYLDRRGWEER
ncbi:MAG: hypothetical protein GY851_08385 [bacterium]|nr:hypothetical protein [bacterium]